MRSLRARSTAAAALVSTLLAIAVLPSAASATHSEGTSCSVGRDLDTDSTWLAAPGDPSPRVFRYRIREDTIPSSLSTLRVIRRIRGAMRYWNEGLADCHYRRFFGFKSAYESEQDSSAANHTDSTNTFDFVSNPVCDRPGVTACSYTRLRDPRVYVSTVGDGTTPSIRESDIRFNLNERWHDGATGRGCSSPEFDLKSLAAHEIGHAVGLDDLFDFDAEDRDKNAWQTMWAFTGSCDTRPRLLGRSDYIGLKDLYTYF